MFSHSGMKIDLTKNLEDLYFLDSEVFSKLPEKLKPEVTEFYVKYQTRKFESQALVFNNNLVMANIFSFISGGENDSLPSVMLNQVVRMGEVCKNWKNRSEKLLQFKWCELDRDSQVQCRQVQHMIKEINDVNKESLFIAKFEALSKAIDLPDRADVTLANTPINVDNIRQLQKDRDLLKVWESVIAQALPNLTFVRTIGDESITLGASQMTAAEIREWLKIGGNQNLLAGIVKLNLSNLKLTSIPAELGLFTNLGQLDLSKNQIVTIENLNNLPQLQALNLSNNQIVKIEGLDKLPQLRILGLSYNQIVTIEGLDSLPQLLRLGLNHNQIVTIENLGGLVQLQQLWLDNNQIVTIENLGGLVQLQLLDLSNNKIVTIENLGGLVQLQKLWLDNNKIVTIENLGGLVQLQSLGLDNNKIVTIEDLDGLLQLQFLDLSNNQIVTIENLDGLLRLQLLDLSNNQIVKIQNLGGLVQLQKLYLSNNLIENLGNLVNLLQNLLQLELVKLDNNPISNGAVVEGRPDLKRKRDPK